MHPSKRPEAAAFGRAPLADMVGVGAVDARSARLWMRTGRPGRLVVRWWPEAREDEAAEREITIAPGNVCDNTASVRMPAEEDGASRLSPRTKYRFRVVHAEGREVGRGRFETAPAGPDDTPSRFAFAVMSCNQPFGPGGTVRPQSAGMLRAALRCLARHDVKRVLMVGDQIYADIPANLSLFDPAYFARVGPPGRSSILDCTEEEVRRLYHDRYRTFWNVPDLQAIHASYPCSMVLDDHDVVDNWGSDPAHETDRWRALGAGALRAYRDYQAARVLSSCGEVPGDFHFHFAYGHTAVFVMDIRSGRRVGADARLYPEAQAESFRRFLQRHADAKVLMIAMSVPVIHVPRPLAWIGARLPAWAEDFSDRWSSPVHLAARDRFLRMLHAHQQRHPDQRVVLLSGDVHVGCVHRLQWKGGPVLYQVISSPVTHVTGGVEQLASTTMLRMRHRLRTADAGLAGHVRLLKGEDARAQNPYGDLNVGIVEVDTSAEGASARLRFLLYGHDGDVPVCVYCSPWV